MLLSRSFKGPTAGGYRGGLGNDPRDAVANHDIAAREQAFVAFRMGGEPSREIVERVAAAADEAGHLGAQPRIDFGDPRAAAVEIGRQYRRAQPGGTHSYFAAASTAGRARKCGITTSPTIRYCSTILSFGVVSGGDRLMCCMPG